MSYTINDKYIQNPNLGKQDSEDSSSELKTP